MTWAYVLAIGLGAAAIVTGTLVRAGKVRSFYPLYRARAAPFYVRNRPFGLLPLGGFFLGFAAFAAAVEHGMTALAVACFLLTWGSFVVGAVWMVRPPEFLKPDWLRAREHSEAAEAVAPGGRIAIPARAYWALWLLLAGLFALWWSLDLSWGWAAGFGMGAATLLAYRPR